MNALSFIVQSLAIIVIISCARKTESPDNIYVQNEENIRLLTQRLDSAEVNANLNQCMNFYGDHAICMPEYQVTLSKRNEIENYYREMFKRQRIKSIRRTPQEFIHLEKTIIAIGTYKREYAIPAVDSSINLEGKYWHVWSLQDDTFRIKGEAFGYFHSVDHPELLVLSEAQQQPDESEIQIAPPFELKAYNALMEKGVRHRNGVLRAGFFTDDAIIYPFADTAVVGLNHIKPYLIAYSSRGIVTIDSVSCYTYAFENLGAYILEYDMFKVKWSRPNGYGKTEGKGIRIWKRQEDKSLRLFREIGTHNYL